jgi:RNA polymerase primary sigma factor
VKYIVLRKLRQSELGWFGEVRRQGRETSRQRALNFDAPEMGVLFPSASATDAIPIALERRDDRRQIACQGHALRRQGKNWRLTGDRILDRRFGAAMPGDLVVMALDLGGAQARGAFEILPQGDSTAQRILSDPQAARLSSNGLVALQACDAPDLVRELRTLDDGLFRSYLPIPAEGSSSNGRARGSVVASLDDFDILGLEPEQTDPAPEDDPSCRKAAGDAQRALDLHKPIDLDAEWAEVSVDLPAEFYRIGRDGGLDDDALERVRGLLLEATIHGCVSERDLDAVVCPRCGDEPDLEFDRRLRVVLDELGVEVEVRPWDEELAPVDRREPASDEEDEVDEAPAFLMALEPPKETAIEAVQREVRAVPTLSESEAAAMHAEIEAGTAETLDGMARSRAAVEEVLRVIHPIDDRTKQLRKVIVCGGDDDMTARLGEFRTRVIEVRNILLQHGPHPGDLIEEAPARRIASIFSQCRFTPQYLEEVWGRLISGGQGGHVTAAIRVGLQRSKVARREIVASNLRLVVWWASQYRCRGLERVDLVGEGTQGLIRAVDRFDRGRDTKLSTYATWWIKQSITRAMTDQGGLIRTPVHVWKARKSVLDHQETADRSTGHRPTAEETARVLGYHPEAVRHLLGDREVLSLDGDRCLGLLLEASLRSSERLPEANASDAELRETIRVCMSALDPRLALVIRGRFGMDGGPEQTLEEMGQLVGVTRERVRQLEIKAIRMLRHPSRARILAPFLGDVRPPAPPMEEHDDA